MVTAAVYNTIRRSHIEAVPFHQPHSDQSAHTSTARFTNHRCPRGSAPRGGHCPLRLCRDRDFSPTNQLLTVDRQRQTLTPSGQSATGEGGLCPPVIPRDPPQQFPGGHIGEPEENGF
ncbi:hypothetical protein PAMP_023287 [Pampus punctatissimus]